MGEWFSVSCERRSNEATHPMRIACREVRREETQRLLLHRTASAHWPTPVALRTFRSIAPLEREHSDCWQAQSELTLSLRHLTMPSCGFKQSLTRSNPSLASNTVAESNSPAGTSEFFQELCSSSSSCTTSEGIYNSSFRSPELFDCSRQLAALQSECTHGPLH